MGNFLSGILGTNSQVGVSNTNQFQQLQPWQQQQQQLAAILQGQASGTSGPNPAQLQLQQNTQAIAQQQATANAQNRAINPGLAARNSGNQAVAAGQGAAANAAIQQGQQQLASEKLLGDVSSQGQTALNQAGGINAGVAAGNQQAAQGIVSGITGGGGAALGLAKGGLVKKMMPSHFKAVHELYHGGSVSNYADGGLTMPDLGGNSFPSSQPASSLGANVQLLEPSAAFGPNMGASNFGAAPLSQPQLGQSVYGNAPSSQTGSDKTKSKSIMPTIDFGDPMAALAAFRQNYAGGGEIFKENKKLEKVPDSDRFSKAKEVPSMVSPGEGYLSPQKTKAVVEGKSDPIKAAEKIPGKAKVAGDSEKNDTVRKDLQEGGLVLPRSVMNSDDPSKEAAKFVADHLRKNKPEKSPEKKDFLDALNRSIKGRRAA